MVYIFVLKTKDKGNLIYIFVLKFVVKLYRAMEHIAIIEPTFYKRSQHLNVMIYKLPQKCITFYFNILNILMYLRGSCKKPLVKGVAFLCSILFSSSLCVCHADYTVCPSI